MSQFYQFNWPASIVDGVALEQNVVDGANVVLNGQYGGDFGAYGFSRGLTFTIAENIENITFTITGTQNGASITEQVAILAGQATVESVNDYNTITSITVSGADVDDLIVGSSNSGIFPLIRLNTAQNTSLMSYALQFICSDPSEIDIYLAISNTIYGGMSSQTMIRNGIFQSIAEITKSGIFQSGATGQGSIGQVLMIVMTDVPAAATVQFLQI